MNRRFALIASLCCAFVVTYSTAGYGAPCESEQLARIRGALLAAHAEGSETYSASDIPALQCLAQRSETIVIVRRRARRILADLDTGATCETLLAPYFSSGGPWTSMERFDALSYLPRCTGPASELLMLRELFGESAPMARAAWRIMMHTRLR